jgi:NADH dehydrogenase
VGAAVFPEHVVAPLRQMIDARSQFIMGRATRVDLERRLLEARTLAGVQQIGYEHLVFAFGTRANLDLVPGSAQHAMPLKLVGDAMHIRNRVLQRVARIELEPDPVERQRLGHFIVIGGGFSGVEVAGAIADFLHGARGYYPRVQPHELKVTVLHDADRLLPELPESLGLAAARSLMSRRIGVRLAARAARVDADGVALASGEFIPGATVVCTIGTRPNPFAEMLPLPQQRGRLETQPDMSVAGVDKVWALGDCALVKNGDTGMFAPPTAQFAVAQARALAKNIVAAIDGRATESFHHSSRGMMATTGHLKGVAEVRGIKLSGLAAWMLWRAYYLLLMPTFGRKLRIFVEWSWSMFFPADITHLRFTRTADADLPDPAMPATATHPAP